MFSVLFDAALIGLWSMPNFKLKMYKIVHMKTSDNLKASFVAFDSSPQRQLQIDHDLAKLYKPNFEAAVSTQSNRIESLLSAGMRRYIWVYN